MKHSKTILTFVFFLVLSVGSLQARSLRVVTTVPDLKDIAEKIGGEQVSVSSLLSGNQDPHFIEPRPSMVARVRRADLFIVIGMELDVWAFSLIDAARNRNITPGESGYLNASARIEKLDVPEPGTRLDASKGHVHPSGNPHYLLNPLNGVIVAETIAARLSELRPEHADYFEENLERFTEESRQIAEEFSEALTEYERITVLAYHESWLYFADQFGIEIADTLEPLPGISPTTRHLNRMIRLADEEDVDLIIQASFYDERPARFVSRQTDLPVVVAPAYVGGMEGADDYFAMFRLIQSKIEDALSNR